MLAAMSPRKRATGYLGELRESRGLKQPQVVRLLSVQFGIGITKSALSRYETGSRESPDPLVMWGLAKIYREPLERLILRVRKRIELEDRADITAVADDPEAECLKRFRRCDATVKREVLRFMDFKAQDGKEKKGVASVARRISKQRAK